MEIISNQEESIDERALEDSSTRPRVASPQSKPANAAGSRSVDVFGRGTWVASSGFSIDVCGLLQGLDSSRQGCSMLASRVPRMVLKDTSHKGRMHVGKAPSGPNRWSGGLNRSKMKPNRRSIVGPDIKPFDCLLNQSNR